MSEQHTHELSICHTGPCVVCASAECVSMARSTFCNRQIYQNDRNENDDTNNTYIQKILELRMSWCCCWRNRHKHKQYFIVQLLLRKLQTQQFLLLTNKTHIFLSFVIRAMSNGQKDARRPQQQITRRKKKIGKKRKKKRTKQTCTTQWYDRSICIYGMV